MELRITNRLKSAGQTVRLEGKRSDASSVSGPRLQADRLVLYRQAVEQMEAQSRQLLDLSRREKKRPALWELDEAGGENSEAKALRESLKAMRRCQKIAARIMRGDKVPPEDEQYLRQNDPEGYKLVMAMRAHKRNPKEWESVLKEEDKSAQSQEGAGEDAASCGDDCIAGETADAGGGAAEGSE
mgnify:FL=1